MAKLPVQKTKTVRKTSPVKKGQPASAPSASDQLMREIERSMKGKTFDTVSDLSAFLATLTDAGKLPAADDPKVAAQEEALQLAFDAMVAPSPAIARKLVKRALVLDPACIDALVLLNSLDARTPEKAIEGLKNAIAIGERSLGAKFTRDNKGHFWLILETRPYMRALAELANLLRSLGKHTEAIGTYEKMLELNPGDNQGVRYLLLGLYLVVGNLAGADRLLKTYKNDAGANVAWARVLERFLSGEKKAATAALKTARKENGFVELYMGGKKKLPAYLPDGFAPGSEEEAILCVDTLAAAWASHPEAVLWLATQVQKEEVKAKILKMQPAVGAKPSGVPGKKKTRL
jgi:tetratricopeptide (TPR) repeat protein